MLRRVTSKHIEEAIEITRKRWSMLAVAETAGSMMAIIDSTECGFCELRDLITVASCIYGKCPIWEPLSVYCCEAWQAYYNLDIENAEVSDVNVEAEKLLKRMDDFDVKAIVRTINKAIAQKGSEVG